jgi:hypothetical protein
MSTGQDEESFVERARRDMEENPELYRALAGNTDAEIDHDKYDYLPEDYSTSSE